MNTQLLQKLNDKRVASLPEQKRLKELATHRYYKVHEMRKLNFEKFGASILIILSEYDSDIMYSTYLPKRYARELGDEVLDTGNGTANVLLLWIERHAYLKFKWDTVGAFPLQLFSDDEE